MARSGEILVINSGSSSVKFGVFEARTLSRVWSAEVAGVGGSARLRVTDARTHTIDVALAAPDHAIALKVLIESASSRPRAGAFGAIGHRVVHGGAQFQEPIAIDADIEARLRALVPLAPLHMPQNLGGIEAARVAWPNVAQIACFDTMFHATLPRRAAMMALPRALFNKGVRRYGFHGLAFESVVANLRGAGIDVDRERIVIAHLGAGASMCALENGRSIETTMGFSTLAGLPMATRCGDVDPGALLYLMVSRDFSTGRLQELLYFQSGLLGLSGVSGDLKTLLARQAEPHVAEAIEIYCYQARRHVASLAAALGGLDRLVFTGGAGANAPLIRADICARLGFLGVALDEARNRQNQRLVSSAASGVAVEAIQADEEARIAHHVARTLGAL